MVTLRRHIGYLKRDNVGTVRVPMKPRTSESVHGSVVIIKKENLMDNELILWAFVK